MISAQFRIQLPEHMWISELSRQFPGAEFTLLSGYKMDGRALELGEVVSASPQTIVEEMRTHPKICDYELLESDSNRALGKYETTQTELYGFTELSDLTIEFPVHVRNGWYSFDLTGTREELEQLESVLDTLQLPYELESLVTKTETETLLTDRQREVLETAVRKGYFAVPRNCTLADLADSLDIDKSTASTTLRRGEARLVKWFLSGPDTKY